MYLELRSHFDCKLYGLQAEFLQEVFIKGRIPTINFGDNEISFTCEGLKEVNARVQVTLISENKF